MKTTSVLVPVALLVSGILDLRAENLKTVDDFRAAAAKTNAVLTVPDWEQTPEAVDAALKNAIATANKALDQIGAQDPGKVTFKSTILALDDLTYQAGNAANKAVIIKESNTNEKMRTAAENAVKEFQDWAVGIDYREDVYKALKAFADTKPKLSGARDSLAKDTNQTVLNQMLALRNKIALRLGYKSWDDFQTEIKMAKTGAGAKSYIDNLVSGIQPKFAAEVGEMQKMKAEDTHNPDAKIGIG